MKLSQVKKDNKSVANPAYSIMIKKFSIYIVILLAALITFLVLGIIGPEGFKRSSENFESDYSGTSREIKLPELWDCNKIRTIKENDTCIYKLATGINNPLACQEIYIGGKKSICYKDIAVSTRDETLCEKAGVYGDVRDQCFFQIAKLKDDVVLCESIELEETRNECQIIFAAESGDVSVCRRQKAFKQRGCYIMIAATRLDLSICDNLKSEDSVKYCRVVAAKQSNNATQCAQLVDVVDVNSCYSELAVKSNNKKVCENIALAEERNKCTKQITGVNSLSYIQDHFANLFSHVGPGLVTIVIGLFTLALSAFIIVFHYLKTGKRDAVITFGLYGRVGIVPLIDYSVFLALCEIYTAIATRQHYTHWQNFFILSITAHFFTFPLFNVLMKKYHHTKTRENAKLFFFYVLAMFLLMSIIFAVYWAFIIAAIVILKPSFGM